MLEFIRDNWKLIVEVVFGIVILLCAIVRKKNITDIFYDIAEFSIKAVKIVEESDVSGAKEKLAYAIRLVNSFLVSKYPEFKLGSYDTVIRRIIEDILSTPQKKEV